MWTRGATRGERDKLGRGETFDSDPEVAALSELDAQPGAALEDVPPGGDDGSEHAAKSEAEEEDGVDTIKTLLARERRSARANLVEHSAVRDARLWSKDEDALLLDIVSRGQPPAPRWSWRLVADQIEGKSSGAVSKHWYKVFKPKYGLPSPGRQLVPVEPTLMDVNSGDESDGDPPHFAYAPSQDAGPSAAPQPSPVSITTPPRLGFLAPYPPTKPSTSSLKFCPPSPEARLQLYPKAASSRPAPKKPPPAVVPEGHWTPDQIELLQKFGPDRNISWDTLGGWCGGRTGKSAQHKWRKLASLGLVGKTAKVAVRPQPAKAAFSRLDRTRRQRSETPTEMGVDPAPVDPLAVPAVASIAGALAKVAGWWRGEAV